MLSPGGVADNAAAGRGAAAARGCWPDNVGSPWPAANAELLRHTLRYNNGFADDAA